MSDPTDAPTPARLPLCGREDHSIACALCEVLADNQEGAWAKGQCGTLSPDYLKLTCDRASGHTGQHGGYMDQHDEYLFWGRK